jgi:hypothetical protein
MQNQSPEINDLGQITWTEYDSCDPPWPYNFTSRIMLFSNGQTEALPLLGVAPQAPDINQQGCLGWKGFDPIALHGTVEIWDTRTTTLLTPDGGAPSLNELGEIAFDRWDGVAERYQVWLYRDGGFECLACDAVHNHTPRINARSELAWSYGTLGEGDIRMLRRLPAGDANCDGVIDAFDIEPFIAALLDPVGYAVAYPRCDFMLADINADGAVDAFDIEPFIALLLP